MKTELILKVVDNGAESWRDEIITFCGYVARDVVLGDYFSNLVNKNKYKSVRIMWIEYSKA